MKQAFKSGLVALLLALPAMAGAQNTGASSATESPLSFFGSLGVLNFLLILIGIELAVIAIILLAKDPANLSLGSFLNSITGKTASQEEMDHAYDGIREIDNPMPAWLRLIFYGTIAWGFMYLVYYHVADAGYLQADEYAAEMAQFEAAKPAEVALNAEELKVITDPAKLEKAKSIFANVCSACHNADGGGKDGPNLTDKYWLHGGRISEIYTTITNGVPGKTMARYKTMLSDQDRHALASYIIGLQGTKPANPRAPEGNLFEGDPNEVPGQPAPVDSATTDSTGK